MDRRAMRAAKAAPQTAEDAFLATVRTSDEAAFGALAERYRRELHVHCYRMLGSFDDAEDLVQETLLRAWRGRATFEGRSSFRAWLYRIATNACLDAIKRLPRHLPRDQTAHPDATGPSEVPWLQPYPDHLLSEIASSDDQPDTVVFARETIELAFLVAIQHLPPRQRAALILRDVLGWSANETAALLQTSVASANSALQRARATLRTLLPRRRLDWAPAADLSHQDRQLLQRYMEATDRGNTDAILAMLHEDARFSMPPQPGLWVGRETIVAVWTEGGFGSDWFGDLRCRLTAANRQPAVAVYHRAPGESEHHPLGLDVLRIEADAIVEIVTFSPQVFPVFGLPATL